MFIHRNMNHKVYAAKHECTLKQCATVYSYPTQVTHHTHTHTQGHNVHTQEHNIHTYTHAHTHTGTHTYTHMCTHKHSHTHVIISKQFLFSKVAVVQGARISKFNFIHNKSVSSFFLSLLCHYLFGKKSVTP